MAFYHIVNAATTSGCDGCCDFEDGFHAGRALGLFLEQMNWLDKLERRFGHIAVPGLMRIIVVLNAVAFVLLYLDPSWINTLVLSPVRVMHGEVWRLVSYLFIPPDTNPWWVLFALYFLWLMGEGLEQEWGAFRLNVFYLCGMLATTLVAFFIVRGSVTNFFLNLSIFLAFATVLPDFEILLFFILPVKVKWLGLLAAAFIGAEVLLSDYPADLVPIISLGNYLLFFGPHFFQKAKTNREASHRRAQFKAASFDDTVETRHRCAACGKTELDDPDLEFRVAEDDKEYCLKHLAQAGQKQP